MNSARAIALCFLVVALNVRSQPVLSIDVNARSADLPGNTQTGFSSFIMAGASGIQMGASTRTYGNITITLSNSSDAFGYDDRLRPTPAPGGTVALTNIFRDFIFSRDNAGTTGLDIAVAGLIPNEFYRFTIYSFDSGSAGNRVSDWTANGNVAITGYAFNGAALPTNNTQYSFAFVAIADALGEVLISGRRTPASVDGAGAASFGVFLNGLQIEQTDPRPIIVTHPRGSTNRVGDRITFSATVDGAPPLSFQWFKDGSEVPGSTAASLTFSNVVSIDSGDYTLRVTNLFGTNISSAATLLVLPDPPPDLRREIVSYWPVDEQLEDEFGRPTFFNRYGPGDLKVVANNLFIEQSVGVLGSAAVFNGIEQYCYREGGFPTYSPPAYSVAFWVNATGAGQSDRRIFAESSTNNNISAFSFGTHSSGANGTLRVFIRNDSGTPLLDRNSTRTPLDGTWHHVAWTETNGEARLYIDGVLDETSFNYARGPVSLDATTIGASLRRDGATNFFSGVLDEVAIWSRVLSFSEIQQILFDGIPAPVSDVAPSITLDPASQSVFTRAKVTFNFAASGTGPLFLQWRRNGTDLATETNATLMLTNVTLANAGNYAVVVTNAVGSITSQVATLTVTLRPVPTDLKIDFNNLGADDVPANTEPGFFSFALAVAVGPGPVTRVFGGAEITLSAVGGINMQSRKRAQPVNTPTFTDERLLQDFIFAADSALDQGMDIRVAFLEPSLTYAVAIWSYDNTSGGNRISDWSANGETVTNGYVFNGLNLPADNTTYRFSFLATTDPEGTILIQGRRNALATVANNVFINALQVTAPALPGELRVQKIELVAPASLRLTFSAISAAATHSVEEKTIVDDPTWTEVAAAVFGPPNGNQIEVTIPVPATATRFYRVVETPAP